MGARARPPSGFKTTKPSAAGLDGFLPVELQSPRTMVPGPSSAFVFPLPRSRCRKRLGAGPHLPHHTCRKLRRKRSKLNSFKSSTTLINPNPKAVKPCALPNAYNSSCPHALASFPLLIFPGAVRRIFAPEGSAAPSCIRASWQGFRLHGRFLLRSSNGFERKHQINW